MTFLTRRWSFVLVNLAALSGVAHAQSLAPSATAPVASPDRAGRKEGPARALAEVERRATDRAELEGLTVPGVAPDRQRGVELGAGIRAYGYLSAAYVWNLADPPARRGANALRLNDADHGTFSLPYAQLGLAREVSGRNELDVGFRAEVGLGRLVERGLADDELFDDLPLDLVQAYAQLQLGTPWGRPFSVRAGRLAMGWGGESLDLRRNANVSLGYQYAFGPRSLTGVAIDVALGERLRYTQLLGNGWDGTIDRNDAKTVGGELVYGGEQLSLRGHWILGAERLDSEADQRWAVGFDVGWTPLPGTALRLSGVYGEEQGGDRREGPRGGLARFGGLSLVAQQGFLLDEQARFHRVSVSARGEWFRDQGGSRSGESQTLAGVTATFEVRPLEPLALRLEYRHDWSSEEVFAGARGARDEQDTFAAELSFDF